MVDTQDVRGKIITAALAPGALAAQADCDLDGYMPEIDLRVPNPIVSIAHINLTDTAIVVYHQDDQVATATPAAGKYNIKDANTIILGDATKALSLLLITYRAARSKA